MTAFAGFDASSYPGDNAMKWLRQNTNFVWCGYYLGPTPSHPGRDWMGKLAFLKSLNWGIAPLYVGQELIGPGSHHTSASQGAVDGAQAAKFMKDEGFDAKSIVYLDLENGLPFPDIQRSYVRAWCSAIASAEYSPGVYCSHTFAEDVGQDRPNRDDLGLQSLYDKRPQGAGAALPPTRRQSARGTQERSSGSSASIA